MPAFIRLEAANIMSTVFRSPDIRDTASVFLEQTQRAYIIYQFGSNRPKGFAPEKDRSRPYHASSIVRDDGPHLGGYVDPSPDPYGLDDFRQARDYLDEVIMGPASGETDYSRVREWIDHCREGHPGCQETQSPALDQTRLFDVQFRCLVRYRPFMQYAALSYVWGNVKRRDVLSVDAFPRTIEHAITVVKALGLRYLWVDSICIDQSDDNDKKTQIGIMDQIYEAALVTIVALHGDNAEGGLPGVDPHLQRDRPLVLNSGNLRSFNCIPDLSEEITMSTWSQRAWTFQEGLLSRRRLIFAQHQVYFVCNEGIASEPSVRLFAMKADNINRPLEFSDSLLQPGWMSPGYARGITTLEDVINRCVDKKSSHDSDSLNSISALLQRISVDFRPQGMAYGLPIGDFRTSLVWYQHRKTGDDDEDRSGTLNVTRRRLAPNLPSWSWAAWDFSGSTINFDTYFRHHLMPPLKISNKHFCFEISPDLLATDRHHPERDRYHTIPFLESCRFYTQLISQKTIDLTTIRRAGELSDSCLDVTGILMNLPCRVAPKVSETQRPPLYTAFLDFPDDLIDDILVRWCNEARMEEIAPVEGEGPMQSSQRDSCRKGQRQDLLLVTAKSSSTWHLVKLYCLHIRWEDGVAVRGGVVVITVENKHVARFWDWCAPNARYRRFWLG